MLGEALRSALPTAPQTRLSLRSFFTLAPSPPRWYHASGAALSVGISVLVGVLTGHLAEGVLAATGAWASLYGYGMPHRRKAWTILAAGAALALGIGLGISTIGNPLLSLVVISLFGAAVTLVANAWAFGPPGPYMLMLSCAVGTALWSQKDSPLLAMAIILGGVLLSLVIQSLPALWDRTGPERRRVEAAEAAVAAVGTDPSREALVAAYHAVDAAWEHLRGAASGQVVRGYEGAGTPRRDIRPTRLQQLDERALVASERLAEVSRQAGGRTEETRPARTGRIPAGPSLTELLLDALTRSHSQNRIAALRVFIGCLIAGALGNLVPFGQPYWAMAAATLLLSSNVALRPNLLKGLNRAVGTGLGMILALLILSWGPEGIALVLVLMTLQFTIENIVSRNYAVAATFITPLALTMASTILDQAPWQIVAGRGIDTAIGLLIAVVILLTVAPLASRRRVESLLLETLDALSTPLVMLRIGADMQSSSGRQVRQRLSRHVTALVASHGHALADARSVAQHAADAQPDVDAVSGLSYDVLAASQRAPIRDAEVGAFEQRLDELSTRMLAVETRHDTAPIEVLADQPDDDWIGVDRG